jgi:hypothetical protein
VDRRAVPIGALQDVHAGVQSVRRANETEGCEACDAGARIRIVPR